MSLIRPNRCENCGHGEAVKNGSMVLCGVDEASPVQDHNLSRRERARILGSRSSWAIGYAFFPEGRALSSTWESSSYSQEVSGQRSGQARANNHILSYFFSSRVPGPSLTIWTIFMLFERSISSSSAVLSLFHRKIL